MEHPLRASRPRSRHGARHIMTKLWKYIEAHHEEFGAALFIVPALLIGLAMAGLMYLVQALQ